MAGDSIRIRNWEKWQSYRKDRGQPPWIKIHRELMRKVEWVELTDAQRGQLVAMWMLAADQNGVIPASPETIKKFCFMDNEPDLQLFTDKGFIDSDATMASEWRQSDEPETEERRIEESREEENSIDFQICEATMKSGPRKGQRCVFAAKGQIAGEWRCGTHGAVDDYSPEFEEFWQSCPRQVSKGNAWSAWPKALVRAAKSSKRTQEESPAEFLTRRMLDYAASVADKDLQYVRHPATWLNGGNWDDEVGSRVPTDDDLKNWRG